MNTILYNLRYGLRQLRNAPGFTITAVLTLALGIGANTAIFTVFNQVLLRRLPVQDPQKLVQLHFIGSDSGRMSAFGGDQSYYFSNPMFRDLEKQNIVFSGMLANMETSVGLVWHNSGEVADAEMVSGSYFQVLGVPAALGRTLVASDDVVKNGSAVAVVSYDYWKTRLGASPDVLNQNLLINGHPFTIVGVAAPGFSSVIAGFKPKVFVPITMQTVVIPTDDSLANPRSRWLNIVARLKPGQTLASAQSGATVLWKQLRANEFAAAKKQSVKGYERFVTKSSLVLTDNAKGFSPLRDGLKTPLLILMGMVLLLAAMTCMNLMSLLLVRAAARGKEFAVRYALGASRSQIVSQMLAEGVLLGLIGGLLGMALAPAVAEFLVRRVTNTTGEVAFSTRPDAWVLCFNLALSLGISVLFSLAPALQMMKPDMTEGLRQKSASNLGAGQRFRTVAIGMQICLSVLLLSGAGLFVRTLHQLKGQSMGLATDHMVMFALDPAMAGFQSADSLAVHDRVRRALLSLPGVRGVAGTTDPILSGSQSVSNITVEGYTPPPDTDTDIEAPLVTPGYFSTFDIPILLGREFTDADRKDAAKVAIVSKSMAVKYFGSAEKAIGHFVAMGGGNAVKLDTLIVGVVADTKHKGVRDGVEPILYKPYAQYADLTNGLAFYVRTTQDPELAETMIRGAVRGVDPKLVPDSMKTMDEQIDTNVSNERMIALLAACFAMIALITTAVGLYGVLAYATAQRTHEIGIRMALGARRSQVVRLILGGMAKVAAVAIVVALPVSVALSRLMRSQLFEVSPFDPLTLFLCVIVTGVMVAVAAAVPARRAASVEPMQALRIE